MQFPKTINHQIGVDIALSVVNSVLVSVEVDSVMVSAGLEVLDSGLGVELDSGNFVVPWNAHDTGNVVGHVGSLG
jgi:hypothetical protein